MNEKLIKEAMASGMADATLFWQSVDTPEKEEAFLYTLCKAYTEKSKEDSLAGAAGYCLRKKLPFFTWKSTRTIFLTIYVRGFVAVNGLESPEDKTSDDPGQFGEGNREGDTAYVDKKTGFLFPALIADFVYYDKSEYGDPESGYGLCYWYKKEVLATIIVYNLGVKNIQDGTNGSHVLSQYNQAKSEVVRGLEAGHYKSVTQLQDLRIFSDAFLTVSYSIIRMDNSKIKSHIFIRGQEGCFIKVRVTTNNPETNDNKVAKFLEEVLRIISSNNANPLGQQKAPLVPR